MKKIDIKYRVIFAIGFISLIVIALYLTFNVDSLYLSKAVKEIVYFPFNDLNNSIDVIGENLNNELLLENEELKKEIELDKSLSNFEVIDAVVIARNPSYWLNSITINKGKKDGLKEGMACVVSEGLIGSISSVTIDTATVRLLSSIDNENKLSVVVGKYNKVLEVSENNLVIRGILKNEEIKNGDVVKTSGLSNLFPSGIAIGKVVALSNDNYDSSLIARIELFADINNLKFVSVLKRDLS